MRTADPAFIAVEEFILVRRGGGEVPVQAMIGTPYRDVADWACPAALHGIDGRYADIHGATSLQALCLAVALIRAGLEHVLAAGDVLLYPGSARERLDGAALGALFGR